MTRVLEVRGAQSYHRRAALGICRRLRDQSRSRPHSNKEQRRYVRLQDACERSVMVEACRVLVVEDEYFLAVDLELALQSEGAEIVGPFCEVSKALNQVAQGGFDVAVLDINLHDGAAYPVADKLIEQRIPFVFATGYSKEFLPNRFWEVQRFEKPYSMLTIAKRVVQLGCQRRGSIS